MSSIDNGGSEPSTQAVVAQEDSSCSVFFLNRHDAGRLAYRLSRGIGGDRLSRQDVRDILAWAESTRREQRMLEKLLDKKICIAGVRDGKPVWAPEQPTSTSSGGVSSTAVNEGDHAAAAAPGSANDASTGDITPALAAQLRPYGWMDEDPEDLPPAPPEAGFLHAVPDGDEMLTVREADGTLREVEMRANVASFFNLDTANSDQSWVGQTVDGRWYYCEDQRDMKVCCRVYPTLTALARNLWAERKVETTVLAVLDELGFLRFELRD